MTSCIRDLVPFCGKHQTKQGRYTRYFRKYRRPRGKKPLPECLVVPRIAPDCGRYENLPQQDYIVVHRPYLGKKVPPKVQMRQKSFRQDVVLQNPIGEYIYAGTFLGNPMAFKWVSKTNAAGRKEKQVLDALQKLGLDTVMQSHLLYPHAIYENVNIFQLYPAFKRQVKTAKLRPPHRKQNYVFMFEMMQGSMDQFPPQQRHQLNEGAFKAQMCLAARKLFTLGWVHTDLLARNVLYTKDPTIQGGIRFVLSDYGSVRKIKPGETMTDKDCQDIGDALWDSVMM